MRKRETTKVNCYIRPLVRSGQVPLEGEGKESTDHEATNLHGIK